MVSRLLGHGWPMYPNRQERSSKARLPGRTRGVLARLRRDEAGNTLAIVAASLIPIIGIIGSGLDIGRAYLVKTRLQHACDAGVLAGRRKMGAGGALDTVVQQEIARFTEFNFPQQSMNTSTYTITPTLTAATETINLTLQTSMTTTLMKIMGVTSVPINASCSARDDYMNVDIMLVLDTTGSMACKPDRNASSCSGYANGGGVAAQTMALNGRTVTYVKEETNGGINISRMQGLRTALSSLRSQMASIEAQFATADAATRKRIRWAIVPFSMMTNPGRSVGTAGTTLYQRNPGWFNTTGSYRRLTCKNDRASCSAAPESQPHDPSWMADVWDGCVEERGTSNAITANSSYQIPNNIPATAYDLQFDLPPSTDVATRWTVADPSKVGEAQYACPKAMREWGTMSTDDFNNYFKLTEGFAANGGTYLDIGLLWAARMMSRTGMWRSENPTTYNGFPVARYVIFMTDGVMDTGNIGYGSYAQEYWEKRVTTDGDDDTSNANHTKRWLMTCNAIKNMDAKIYAISFGAGSNLSTDLQACSSGTGYAFKADDNAALRDVFGKIADNIGSLRLSQ